MNKKTLILLFGLVLFITFILVGEEVLIDFTVLQPDLHVNVSAESNGQSRSIAIENWEVQLSPNARTVRSMNLSETRVTPSRQWGTVLGARMHFITEIARLSGWARINPPFTIPAHDSRFEGQGLLTTDRPIKDIHVTVYGHNFPLRFNLNLLNANNDTFTFNFGYIYFDGWETLSLFRYKDLSESWLLDITEENRRTLANLNASLNSVRLQDFTIIKDARISGGDYIVYFKDVKIIYE